MQMTHAYYQYKTILKKLFSTGLVFVPENPFGSDLCAKCSVQSDMAIWSVCSSASGPSSSHPGNNSNSGQRSGILGSLFGASPIYTFGRIYKLLLEHAQNNLKHYIYRQSPVKTPDIKT